MKARFLFPTNFRIIGVVVLMLGLATAFFTDHYFETITAWQINHPLIMAQDINVWINDWVYLCIILGLLFISFSKEDVEDELIAQLRLDSLQLSIYINYALLIMCVIFINGMSFLSVIGWFFISPLLVFFILFRWKIYQLNRLLKKEEAQV